MSVVAGVISVFVRTHVCCINNEPVVTVFLVVLLENTVVLQTAGCYRTRSQLAFAVLALVSVYECACTCAGRGKQSAVTVPATATAQTCVSKPRSPLNIALA